MKKIVIMICVALVCVSCASVPLASIDDDVKAKEYSSPSDKAAVFVYRTGRLGAKQVMKVSIDGNEIGRTQKDRYLYKEIDPGFHTISGKAENISVLDLGAEAGKIYFVWQQVAMGVFSTRNTLKLVDEETGKRDVTHCRLSTTK